MKPYEALVQPHLVTSDEASIKRRKAYESVRSY